MLVVGLTGSIGMGKSTVARLIRARGIAVFDADAEVHRLYENEAVPFIAAAFPGTTMAGRVDRATLAAALSREPDRFAELESIVHPLVKKAEAAFLAREAERKAPLAVLEIPLLFETGLDAKVDKIIVVSAPAHLQRARVLARSDITEERLDALLARQTPDAEKRARADFVVDTGASPEETTASVNAIIDRLEHETGSAYSRFWRVPTAE